MIAFKTSDGKNRRRVDFYTHVVATTPEDSFSRRRIWRYGERSFPSMRTASFRGFFTSGRRSRGRRSDLLKLPIIILEYGYLSTKVHLPLIAHKRSVIPHFKTTIFSTGSSNRTSKIEPQKALFTVLV